MKTLLTLGSLFLGLSLAAAISDTSGYVVLTADDPGGSYSFNKDLGRWNPAVAPSAGNKYLVQGSASAYRLLRSDSSTPFAGDSLTLDFGEIRKSGSATTCTVTNLIVYKGRLGTADVSGSRFAGEFFLQEDGDLEFRGGRSRQTLLTPETKIHGASDTTLTVQNSTDPAGRLDIPYYTVVVQGDLSDFHGTWQLKSTANATCRTALIVSSEKNLGAMDEGQTVARYSNIGGFFGDGLTLANANARISAPQGLHLGSYENGLALLDGAIDGEGTLTVTNRSGTTTLGDVALSGFGKLALATEGTSFTPDYSIEDLPLESACDLTVRFDADEKTYCKFGSVSLANARIRVVFTGNVLDLATNKNDVTGFSYPVLKMSGLGTDFTTDDFIPENCGVPGAALAIRDGVLYFERTETSKYVYLTGWAGTTMTQGDCWTKASLTASGKTMAWSDGAAPSSDKNYLIPPNQSLRCRTNVGFAGKSLTVLDGGSVSYSDYPTFTLGAPFIGHSGGMLLQRTTGSIRTVKGQIELPSGSTGRAFSFVTEGPNGTTVPRMTVEATLSGSGNIDFHGVNGGNVTTSDFHPLFADSTNGDRTRGLGEFVFTGDNSAFTGGISMQSTHGSLTYATPQSLGGDPARFLKGGLTVAGGTKLVIQADISCGATRGVCFDLPYPAHPDATFEIAEGKTLTLAGAACGAANPVKTGAGTLVLNGASTATGQTRLEAGTLALGAPTALGANNLVVADGTTLRLDCAGVIVGGEIPFVQANGEAVESVNVSVPALINRNVQSFELFVLKDVTAFDCTKLRIANVSAAACRFLTEQRNDGLHITVKRMTGCVVIFR